MTPQQVYEMTLKDFWRPRTARFRQELVEKGVPQEIVDGWLDEMLLPALLSRILSRGYQ